MRVTSQALFPFNDSLVALNRRQSPVTQTDRGNYEWSWAQAAFVFVNESGDIESSDLQFAADTVAQVVMFGADVPHTAWLFGADARIEPALLNLAANTAALATYINVTLAAWFDAAVAAVPTLPAAPVDIALQPIVVGIAKLGGVYQLTRPTAFGGTAWAPVVDAGQGTLPTFTVGASSDVTVQGFPLALEADLVIGAGDTAILDHPVITVGFESGTNHGLGASAQTGGGDDAQTAYSPIVLEQASYTQAIKDNGNILVQGGNTFVVVGVWSVFTPGP